LKNGRGAGHLHLIILKQGADFFLDDSVIFCVENISGVELIFMFS
jgi:hypothetical protein